MVKELSLPNYLPIAGRRIVGFLPISKVLSIFESMTLTTVPQSSTIISLSKFFTLAVTGNHPLSSSDTISALQDFAKYCSWLLQCCGLDILNSLDFLSPCHILVCIKKIFSFTDLYSQTYFMYLLYYHLYYYYYYYYYYKYFISVLTGGFSLKSKWQQDFSGLQDSILSLIPQSLFLVFGFQCQLVCSIIIIWVFSIFTGFYSKQTLV